MFEDIRIIGVDKERSEPLPAKSDVVGVYFKLSARPPTEWVAILEADWRASFHRFVRVECEELLVTSPNIQSLEGCLELTKENVRKTNEKYRLQLDEMEQGRAAAEAQEQQRRASLEQRQKRLSEALDALTFDD